ncbi:unnamed protein product [Lupinus luteus]|uniref:Calcineurin-like phosphoesterase domain-containing protein n=1 Tax=Lupinus luteus TaxID=3873 RepID=A0AAV1Y8C3_LUPLU
MATHAGLIEATKWHLIVYGEIYIVLGNHDYKGNVEAQLSHVLQQRDKRWLCLRSYIDVDLALKQSRAKWKFVVGHHPIKSAGENGNTKELEKQLLPILEAS